jgi:predicted hydrocarbon binding protein
MQRIEKSGFRHSNLLTYSILSTLEDILGSNGLTTLLRYASLDEYITHIPPANLDEGADFADTSTLFQAVEEIYGIRGGHALLARAGRKGLDAYREKFGPMMTFLDMEIKLIPREKRTKHGLDFLLKLITRTGEQRLSSSDDGDELIYQIANCSASYGRPATDHPVCHIIVGAMQGILHWVTGGEEHQVVESCCAAKGDTFCEFHVSKVAIISSKAV